MTTAGVTSIARFKDYHYYPALPGFPRKSLLPNSSWREGKPFRKEQGLMERPAVLFPSAGGDKLEARQQRLMKATY